MSVKESLEKHIDRKHYIAVNSEDCVKESLEKHIDRKHYIAVNSEDCGHKSHSNDHLKEHMKEHHTIEQLDGVSELLKSTKMIEHDELWCHECQDQLPNRTAMKAHMPNEHNITIFEDIDMESMAVSGTTKFLVYTTAIRIFNSYWLDDVIPCQEELS